MLAKRRGHAATLLPDGRVLVAGGWSLNDPAGPPRFAELFDPKIGTWSKAGSMTRWRYGPIAVTLRDGRVLVIGGFIDAGGVTKGGEIYDPGHLDMAMDPFYELTSERRCRDGRRPRARHA